MTFTAKTAAYPHQDNGRHAGAAAQRFLALVKTTKGNSRLQDQGSDHARTVNILVQYQQPPVQIAVIRLTPTVGKQMTDRELRTLVSSRKETAQTGLLF